MTVDPGLWAIAAYREGYTAYQTGKAEVNPYKYLDNAKFDDWRDGFYDAAQHEKAGTLKVVQVPEEDDDDDDIGYGSHHGIFY